MTTPLSRSQDFRMCDRLLFGPGTLQSLPEVLAEVSASKVLIVTDAGILASGLADQVTEVLEAAGIAHATYSGVEPDPRVEIVADAVEAVRQAGADVLVAVGGGSPIDIAKVAAIVAVHGGDPLDYAGIGKVPGPGLPVIAIPTTAGTGSEVTPIAVLSDKKEQLKKGLVSEHLYPATALVDPALTVGLPPRITAYTGMDALTHCLEAYTNKLAHPLVDTFAVRGIELIGRSIRRAFCQGSDLAAREDMALGSLMGGLCLGTVNTAAVHALAYPLGGTYNIPHGLANTLLLPHVMAFNVPADLGRHAEIARLLGQPTTGLSPRAAAQAAVVAVSELAADLGMNLRLRDFGIPEDAIPTMAEAAMKVTRLMQNNPRTMSVEACAEIYRQAW